MAKRIATVSGTALVPGVSKNGRLYTPELIADAVKRAQGRIAEGTTPLTMLTHHAADDDSTRIVGSLTSISVAEDGSARFTADVADTVHGRDIAALLSGDTPHLRGVSIRGAWVGKVRREKGPDGSPVETADGLEIDGLDYTRKPGVPGAVIDTVKRATTETGADRVLIYESVEALVTSITEETTVAATPTAAAYADPGYRPDGAKRWPLDTKPQAKAAWSAVHEASSARTYTAPQKKRIRQRIVKALKQHGVQVDTAEGYLVDPIGYVSESTDVSEYYGDSPSMAGSFCVELCNGPLRITISSYCVDPADLDLIGRAAMDGAVQALKAIDPDTDGDMDVPGADAEDTDGDMESAPGEGLTETGPAPEHPAEPAGEPETPAPVPAAVPQTEEEEPAMAEPTTPAVEQSPAATVPASAPSAMDALNAKFDKLTDAIGGLVSRMTPAPMAPAETAPVAAVVAETQEQTVARLVAEGIAAQQAPAAVAETDDQRIARLVGEAMVAERQRIVEQQGPPTRKGLVAQAGQTAPDVAERQGDNWPMDKGRAKELYEFTREELTAIGGQALREHVLGGR